MKVRLLAIAEAELDEAVAYYNSEEPGLGYWFLSEALDAIDRIKEFPNAWQPFHRGTRRCRLRHFPYGVIYQTDEDGILVVAVAHLHREPDYWCDRIRK
jgi:plasmid stabilization system protein ParE